MEDILVKCVPQLKSSFWQIFTMLHRCQLGHVSGTGRIQTLENQLMDKPTSSALVKMSSSLTPVVFFKTRHMLWMSLLAAIAAEEAGCDNTRSTLSDTAGGMIAFDFLLVEDCAICSMRWSSWIGRFHNLSWFRIWRIDLSEVNHAADR